MKVIKQRKHFLFFLLVGMLFLFRSVAVFALTEEETSKLKANAMQFIETIYQASEEELEQAKSAGAFYEIAVNQVLETKESLGAFQELGNVKTSESGDQFQVIADARFEKGSAKATLMLKLDEQTGKYTPSNFLSEIQYSLGEKMAQAGFNTVVGLVTVFGILFFLAFVIYLFRFIPKEKISEEAESKPVSPRIDYLKPNASTKINQEIEVDDEDEIAAVIVAAIAAATAEHPEKQGYIVRSVRRRHGNHRWKRA